LFALLSFIDGFKSTLEDSSEGEGEDKKEMIALEEILADSESEDEFGSYNKVGKKVTPPSQIVYNNTEETKNPKESSTFINQVNTPNPMEEIKEVTPGDDNALNDDISFEETPQHPFTTPYEDNSDQLNGLNEEKSNIKRTTNEDNFFKDPIEIVDQYENSSKTAEVLVNFTRPIEDMMSKNSLNITRMVYSYLKNIGTALINTEPYGSPSCICVSLLMNHREIRTIILALL